MGKWGFEICCKGDSQAIEKIVVLVPVTGLSER
jgi:hypothetical protein